MSFLPLITRISTPQSAIPVRIGLHHSGGTDLRGVKSKTTNPEHHTLYPDAPAVQLNQAFDDRETQSGAPRLRRVRRAAEDCIEDLR